MNNNWCSLTSQRTDCLVSVIRHNDYQVETDTKQHTNTALFKAFDTLPWLPNDLHEYKYMIIRSAFGFRPQTWSRVSVEQNFEFLWWLNWTLIFPLLFRLFIFLSFYFDYFISLCASFFSFFLSLYVSYHIFAFPPWFLLFFLQLKTCKVFHFLSVSHVVSFPPPWITDITPQCFLPPPPTLFKCCRRRSLLHINLLM